MKKAGRGWQSSLSGSHRDIVFSNISDGRDPQSSARTKLVV